MKARWPTEADVRQRVLRQGEYRVDGARVWARSTTGSVRFLPREKGLADVVAARRVLLQGGLARHLEAVCRLLAALKGNPSPRPAMVSERELNNAIRPTMCSFAIISYSEGFPVGCSRRSVTVA